MIIAFVIWSIVTLIFVGIGISAWHAKEEFGFFTFSEPKKMRDVVKYNHAVAILWFTFAVILEIIGIPILFLEQNSPITLLIVIAVIVLIIMLMVVYMKIEKKFQEE